VHCSDAARLGFASMSKAPAASLAMAAAMPPSRGLPGCGSIACSACRASHSADEPRVLTTSSAATTPPPPPIGAACAPLLPRAAARPQRVLATSTRCTHAFLSATADATSAANAPGVAAMCARAGGQSVTKLNAGYTLCASTTSSQYRMQSAASALHENDRASTPTTLLLLLLLLLLLPPPRSPPPLLPPPPHAAPHAPLP
jgi:hypothetical protein